MTKHTPATPLPWKVVQAGDPNNVPRIMSEKGGVAVLCVNRFMGEKGPSKEEMQQAAYLAHACNAYPKLVEALREATESLDDLLRAPKAKHFRQEEATRFYALLRELGE